MNQCNFQNRMQGKGPNSVSVRPNPRKQTGFVKETFESSRRGFGNFSQVGKNVDSDPMGLSS